MLTLNSEVDVRYLAEVMTRLYPESVQEHAKYNPRLVWVIRQPSTEVSVSSDPSFITDVTGLVWAGHHPTEVYKTIWTLPGMIITLGPWDASVASKVKQAKLQIKLDDILPSRGSIDQVFSGLGHRLIDGTMVMTGGSPTLQGELIELMRQNPPVFTVKQPDLEPVSA